MLDEREMLKIIGSASAGPLPDALSRAVRRRRRAVTARRAAPVAMAVLAVAAAVGWLAQPSSNPSYRGVVAMNEPEEQRAVRFAAASVLGLRQSGLEGTLESRQAPSRAGSRPTALGLRQRAMLEGTPPAS